MAQPAQATNDTIFRSQARIEEAEECIEGLTSKVATTEKLRNRYNIDLEDLQAEYERVNGQVAVAEKKLKTFDLVRERKKLCLFLFSSIVEGIATV